MFSFQCSILLAIHDYQMVFILITLLIALHAIAVLYISLYVQTHSVGCDKKTILSFCVRGKIITMHAKGITTGSAS